MARLVWLGLCSLSVPSRAGARSREGDLRGSGSRSRAAPPLRGLIRPAESSHAAPRRPSTQRGPLSPHSPFLRWGHVRKGRAGTDEVTQESRQGEKGWTAPGPSGHGLPQQTTRPAGTHAQWH